MELPRFGLGVSNCRSTEFVTAAVQDAERRGAAIAFVAEDLGCRDAFVLLARCAASTSTIRLATGVVNPYTRTPLPLAMAVAALQETSDGRAVLGLGTGSIELLRGQLGIDPGSRVRVLAEAVQIVRELVAGAEVTHVGDYFNYRNVRLEIPHSAAPVPVFLAAMGPLTLRLAGRVADGVLLNVGASPQYVRWAVRQIGLGAAEAGRSSADITVAGWLSIYVTEDYEHGLQRAAEFLAAMLSIPGQGEALLGGGGFDQSILPDIRREVGNYPARGDRAAASRYLPREVVERSTLVGTVDEVRERVQEYREAGLTVPVLGPAALRALYPAQV